ncbi:type VI secretion system contractile sheath small subunit [Lysobacter antibioticus]|uniref:type VI secretion system contractile sheath small subunit n=1 Tax=Lysobacter antibioticus TaxID=84531 RepID=UPI000346FE9D|nr:type VI secretion system contractile sheath small subunit [Lysobacter antibioticus]
MVNTNVKKGLKQKSGGQKFIGRNRAPRVQIEYDVELYGSERKVEIPFVMGVMADLAGKSKTPPKNLEQRQFLEVDVDNFDERLKSVAPRVAFQVPNKLTEGDDLLVDVTFESMDDFSPAQVARKVEPLSRLLEARVQLANLLSYMDGKNAAEELIARALREPALLAALANAPKPAAAVDASAPAGDDSVD